MGDYVRELNQEQRFYINLTKKEISGLNITAGYKTALIKCVEKLFDPSQLPESIPTYEYNIKMIAAERHLVFTRFYASENDVLFACPHIIEDDILHYFHEFISKKLK